METANRKNSASPMRASQSGSRRIVPVLPGVRDGGAGAASDVLDIPECPPDAIGSRRAAAVFGVIFDLLQRLHGLRERGLGGLQSGVSRAAVELVADAVVCLLDLPPLAPAQRRSKGLNAKLLLTACVNRHRCSPSQGWQCERGE